MRLLFLILALILSGAAAAATSCGGQLQPPCEMNAPVDAATNAVDVQARDEVDAKNAALKGSLDGIEPDRFKWTFIPEIPTAQCVNPQVESPTGSGPVEMDICTKFYIFQKFINGVLAFFCLIGCVRLVQDALATK